MSIRRRGRVYWYRRMMGGRVYERSLRVRVGQEALLSEALREMDMAVTAEHLGLPYKRHLSMPFGAYADRHLAEEKSQVGPAELAKKRSRLEIVKRVWSGLELRQIGRDDIARLERFLLEDRGVGETTVNRYFEMIAHLYRRAVEDGYATESPCRFYTPYREGATRRALSVEELRAVIVAAAEVAKTPHAPNFAPILDMVVFALHTGARLSEILHLRLEWIRGGSVMIPIQKTKSKRRSNRRAVALVKTVPLDAAAAAAVERHRKNRVEGYVFPLRRRDPDAVRLAMLAIRERSGVADFGFHVLRHTYVTEASAMLGATAAQTLVGHSDLKTTARYSHPRLAEIEAASAKLGTALPGYEAVSSSAD